MVTLGLSLAALALWVASRLAWGTEVRARPGTDATTAVAVPGAEVAPALVPLAVLALAAIAGVVALGGLARRALGLVVALAGVVPLYQAIGPGTWGRALAVTGGALLVAVGLLLLSRGHRMARLGARYRTPGAAKESEPDLWRALSDGEDPTAREP
ncbi:Trp biosynthesis-associated membrane protein [Actinokineospora sp.]|uniref:Trp biosynthesis-associated membrane protein n=1 Tax=Actinokineospora sp. TaxID=1872133 RepID=UPI0040384C76